MGGGNSKVNKVVPQVEHIVPYVDCFNEYSRQTITLRPSNNILEDFPVLDENPNETDDAMQCLIENLEMKNMIVNVLVNVFQEIISNNVLESLLKHMMPVRHTKGSIILSRGDINDTFYIVIEGAVTSNNKWNGSANKEMNDIDMSNETIDLSDTILSSGMTFGRLGLLLDAPSSSTVIASSEETCVLLKLERKIFRHFQKLIVLEAYIGRCLRLSSVAEFANLRNDKLAAIASVMKTKFINAGEYIYSHKEMSDKLVVVEKGFAILEIMEDVPVSPYKGNNGQAMGGSNVNHCRSMDDEEEDERVPFYRELSGPLPTPAADEATNAASNPNSESDPTAPSRFTKKFDEMTAEEQMDLYGFSRPPTMSDNTKQSLLATSLANLRSNTTPMPAAETPRANDPVDTGIVSANDSRSLNEKRILYEGCVVGSNILKGRAKLPGGWLYTSRSAAASAHDPSQPFSFGSVTPFDMIAIGDGCWISYISVDMIEHKLGALSAALRKCNTSSNLKDPKRDFKWNITGTAYSISPATTPRTVQNHTETEVDVGSTDVESRRDTAQEVPDSHWFRVIENNDYIRFIKSGSNGLTKVYSCMNAHVFGNTYGNMPITGNMNNSNRGLRNEDNESVSQSLRLGEGKFNVPATLSLRLSPNARYTLKMYDKTAVVRENAFQMPLNEVYYLFSLDNTFIAKGRAYFQTLNSLCIATESVCYGSVFNLLYHDERYEDLFGNGIPLDVIQFYLSNIILALSYFHSKGLVYRNLKPENLLIGQDGYLKLIGLELVRKLPYCVDEVCFHKTFTQCGTLEYFAPEQLSGTGYGASVDMWALGVVAYEMLTAKTPFVRKSSVVCVTPHTPTQSLSPTEKTQPAGTFGSDGKVADASRIFPVENTPVDPNDSSVAPRMDKNFELDIKSTHNSKKKTTSSPKPFGMEAVCLNILSLQNTRIDLVNDKKFFKRDTLEFRSFVEELICYDPQRRMTSARRSTGCSKAACSHRFFRDFDWNNVETKQYCAAYIPFQKKPAYSWHPGHNKRQELAMCNSSTAGDMGSRSFLNNASLSESGQKNEADKRMGNGIDAESVYTGDQALFAKFNQILSI